MLNLLTTMAETAPSMSEDTTILIFLVVYGVVFGGLFAVLFVYWLFKAIAIFKMSKKLNLNMPWIGFVPYCLPFAYGRLAEQYNGKVLKKPIKFSILLLILQFVPGVAVMAFYIVFIFLGVVSALLNAEVLMIIGFLICYFVMLFITIVATFVVNFFNYLACWNVFGIFAGDRNVLYFILSLTLGIEPFLLFALRNKEPQNLKEEFVIVPAIEEAEVVEEN